MSQALLERLDWLAEQHPGIHASIAGVWRPDDILATFPWHPPHPSVVKTWFWNGSPAIVVSLWTEARIPAVDQLAVRHLETIGRKLGAPDVWVRLAKSRPWNGGFAATDKLPMKRLDVEPLGDQHAAAIIPTSQPLLLASGWTAEPVATDHGQADGWLVESHDVLHDLAELLRPDIDKAKAKPARQAVVLLDPPQITLEDGTAFALTPDQAEYLQALIEAGDWLSDPEFRRQNPKVGENARPDQWRKSLPDAVKARIETTQKHGSRWRESPV